MFLPIKTEAHDGRFRMGALAIVGICFIVHILVQQDFARRQEQLTQLQDQVSRDSIDTHVTDMIKEYAGDNGLSDSTTISNHIEKMKSQSEVLEQVRKQTLFYKLALVSGDFNPINLITNLFTHSGWMHLIGNMWFFYLLGVTMEKYWGLGKFIGIYLSIGVLGNLAFLIVNGLGGREVSIPVVGASGAIAGMMGAFAVTHGEAKVTMFIMGGFRGSTFQISSRLYLAFWILTQIAESFWNREQAGGVAYSAHIVGFLSGMAAGKFIKGDVFYSKAYQVDEGPKI